MIRELIDLIETIKAKITDDSDLVWTSYNHAKDLRNELDLYVEQLKLGDITSLEDLHTHFLPTCTFQEHSISNGWMDEYIRLSEKFDTLYLAIKGQI